MFLDLLAPCARRLGSLWEDDAYDFTQVTIGLWRLQELLYEQSSRLVAPVSPDLEGQRALLAAVPGTQHTFGVTMVAELFSRAGWDVLCENRCQWSDLDGTLSREWFDMFGLSVSTTESIPSVASAILKLRQVSANPKVLVMVGGPMAAIHDDLARLCGADAMAAEVAGFYASVAQLLHAQPRNIAFAASATDAYAKALSALWQKPLRSDRESALLWYCAGYELWRSALGSRKNAP